MIDASTLIPLFGALLLGALSLYLLLLILGQLSQARSRRRYQDAERDRLWALTQQQLAQVEHDQASGRAAWEGTRKFVVSDKVEEAKDICSFYLSPHDGKPLASYQPGQFLTFQLHIPGQPKPVVRCYSLSDAPPRCGQEDVAVTQENNRYRVSIKRIPPPRDNPDAPPGLSSGYFHDQINPGDILDVKAPGGHFFLDTSHERPVVLIGGGIGITPVLSMLNYLVATGSKREIWFYLGVINSIDQPMKEHLATLRSQPNINIRICYSNPLEGDVEGKDYDVKGWVGVDLFKEDLGVNNYDFYICGPPPMMSMVTANLGEWGVPDSRIHFEAFGPASVKKPGQKQAEPEKKEEAIEITFARSEKTLTWTGEHENLLEFGLEHDIPMDSGCRAGTNCGSCTTAIHKGEVDYVGDPNTADVESGACLTCCAIPKGPLTLDA